MDIILKVKYFWKEKLLQSMQLRIIVCILAFAVIPAAIIRMSIIKNYESKIVSSRTSEIQNQCTILCNLIDDSNYLSNTKVDTVTSELRQLSSIYNGRVLVIDDNYNIIQDTYDMDTGKTIVAQSVIQCYGGKNAANYDRKNKYIEVTAPIYQGDSEKISGVLLVSVSTQNEEGSMRELALRANIILGTISIIALLLGVIISIAFTKPIHQLAKEISHPGSSFDFENVDISTFSEIEEVCQAYNHVSARYRMLDESRKDFVSNVSHELKTPMASVKVLSDSLLNQKDVPEELYREFLEDITQEIDRENKVIDDLLLLVKLDRKSGLMNIETVNINALIERNLHILRPIAAKQDIELIFESIRPVEAEVDEIKFSAVLRNLVENAIKYNRPEGSIHVRLNADYQYFYMDVEDNGIGIPQKSLLHVFERFYRVDKSHSREIGGTGLGLAITQSAVVMHHGTIEVSSEEFVGTKFSVTIPLKYIR